jgi:hypothetical protein
VKRKDQATCKAICDGNRIQLRIRKGRKGYDAFAKVLREMEEHGSMSWYGDITDADGTESVGIIITANDNISGGR